MIRQNKNIKGILIGETEYKISQYADDTEIMLEGDKNSFEETVKIINTFGNKSGLFLSMPYFTAKSTRQSGGRVAEDCVLVHME